MNVRLPISYLFAWAIVHVPCTAQVSIDAAIELTGASQADRQLTGLPMATNANAALSAGVIQNGSTRYGAPEPGAVWEITGLALQGAPLAGTHMMLRMPAGSSGAVVLRVNEHGPYDLLWSPGQPVDAGSLPANAMLSVVFDGTAFQLLNQPEHHRRPCPSGMVAVNDGVCVDVAQGASVDFDVAVLACSAVSKRLCTWGEFVSACGQNATLGLLTPNPDWEWVNTSGNEVNSVRTVRLSNCGGAGVRLMTGPTAPYRCCLSR
ncbi:MAG: hypothetical protein JNM62_03260 [Flavobacteriales bacterium]|nr:hypothetical protein [Flavobacteriales bacterium]